MHFALYNVKPLIVINVLDPATHIKAATKQLSGVTTSAKVQCRALLSSLTAKSGETNLTKGTDYTVKYEDGELVFTVKNKNKITGGAVTLRDAAGSGPLSFEAALLRMFRTSDGQEQGLGMY